MVEDNDPRFDRTFGDMPPPPPSRQFFPILSPKPGQEVKAIITANRPLSVWKHFVEKCSYPCTRAADCPYCKARHSPRWMSYVSGLSIITGKAVLIELTAHAYHSCPALKSPETMLRGKVITLARRGRAANSPVIAKIEEATGTVRTWKLPQPFDVKSSLLRMWGNPFGFISKDTAQSDLDCPGDFLETC